MPEQRENSVLFSLKELRGIEDERIRQEEAELRAREEAERRSREEADRRARDDVERRSREEQDRVQRIEQERLARDREEQMRLQETERRARVEGEMRLQEERMRMEKARSPMPAILGVGAVVVILAGAIIYKLNSDAQAEKVALQMKAADEAERIKKEADAERRRFEGLINQKEKALKEAKTVEEKAVIQAEIERERRRNEQQRARPQREEKRGGDTAPTTKPKIQEKRKVSDDPLDGLKL
jgi:hypothetical protein